MRVHAHDTDRRPRRHAGQSSGVSQVTDTTSHTACLGRRRQAFHSTQTTI